jgi:hypothetical protein
LSISPYRNCVVVNKDSILRNDKWLFNCESENIKYYKNETTIPTTIKFSFKSAKIFQLAICGIFVYHVHDDCGIPNIPLHASYIRINDKSIEYFPIPQRNKHRMIGDGVITCLYAGNGDKKPPIFEPIIKCSTDEIDMNSGLYKRIKFENYEFFFMNLKSQ